MRKKKISSRQNYLETETGGWRKKWKGRLPVALLFPNSYHLGMSNLGFQLVYDLINQHPDFVCERVFFPSQDSRLLSIESGRSLADFHAVFFSVSFEQDYPNIIRMLLMGAVEPLAEKRQDHTILPGKYPLVVGGGVATLMNPEPLAPFMDMFIIGEGEPVIPILLDLMKKKSPASARQEFLLEAAVKIPGCYVPAFYDVSYKTDGTLVQMAAQNGVPEKIVTVSLADPSETGCSKIMSSEAEFSNMFLAELGRGCSRGCRFCAAGFVYRPPRLWSADKVISALKKRPQGLNRIGLLGMEMAQPDDLDTISTFLCDTECSLSFSSLRADAVSRPGLQKLLASSGLKSAALAPDGGSERLRRVINKGFHTDDILSAATILFEVGIVNLKLYFMIGLPTETEDDLQELIQLVVSIRERMLAIGRPKGRLASLTLSINCFVPKPWTPFQFAPFLQVNELKAKLQFIRGKLAGFANLKILADPPDRSFFQAVLARGDRKVGMALLTLVKSEKNWRQLFHGMDVEPGFYAQREREKDELFPWDILDHGIRKNYLWKEYGKALKEEVTESCDTEHCHRCGVCKS